MDLKNQADAEKLIAQKLLVHQRRTPKKLILFRRIVKHSSLERVVEVKNLRHPDELSILKARLAAENATVVAEDPPEASWTTEYPDRVVWKLRVQSTHWQVPTAVTLPRGHLQLLPAPNCDMCHSDDHHQSRCSWREFIYSA